MILSPTLLEGSGLSNGEAAKIKNIVFDFGGVLIELLPEKVGEMLEKFGYRESKTIFARLDKEGIFDMMDIGMKPEIFRDTIREVTGLPLKDHQVDEAFMAILGQFRPSNFPILRTLQKHYKTFVLSNTNLIHSPRFMDFYLEQTGSNIFLGFDGVFYSHDLESRKPDRIIFERFAESAGVHPEESLFIDDLPWNVEGARNAGFHAFWMNLEVCKDLRPLFLTAG